MPGLFDSEAWAESGRRAKGLLAQKVEELKALLQHPRAVYEGTADPYDPGMALGMAGMAMTGGVAGAPKGAIGSGPIRAYHGSPHDFDRFDNTKIGTGEGTSRGHGHYLAEDEAVAQSYRDRAGPDARMYEARINADPERFIDLDRSLADQHPEVRAAVDQILDNPAATFSIPDRLDADAARRLHEAGVPGVKYLDELSQATGEGTRNYTVFDDSIIEIVRKYGIAGLAMVPPAVLIANGIDPASVGHE